MQTVKIPAHIKEIGTYAFAENKSLKTLEIADGVEKIDSGAFEHCEELTKVTIPASVKEIKEYAFNGCEKLDLKLSGSTAYATNPPEITRAPKTTDTPKPTGEPIVTDTPKETIITTIEPSTPEPKRLEVTGGEEIKISVDGKAIEFDAKPFIDGNDRTLVPIRAVSEMLDAKVDWDEQTQTVTISQDEKIVKIVIGSDTMTVDGNAVKMDTQAVISEERTYVPIRFAAEALGLTVNWVE